MFYKIFSSYPEKCKRLLEILLGLKISRIEFPQGERVFDVDAEAHSIRLDIFTQDKNHVYDIEMQTTDEEELPERARYYQSLMDISMLKPGEPYKNLKDSIVIFICLSDPFSQGRAKYEFRNLDAGNGNLELGDRTVKLFFNAAKYDKIQGDEELRSLLGYFSLNKTDSAFTSSLEELVKVARQNEQWRQTYMTLERFKYYAEREGHREGFKAGREEGMQVGMQQGMQVGMQQGIQQGISQGIQQGISKGAAQQKAEDEKLLVAERERSAQKDAEIQRLKALLAAKSK